MRCAWPMAIGVGLAVLACSRAAPVVPSELLGRWVCEDARYEGRSLTISQRSLIFASGRTASQNFAVRGVETQAEPDGSTLVTIDYANEQASGLSLSLQLLSTSPKTLTIGERPEIWVLAPAVGYAQ